MSVTTLPDLSAPYAITPEQQAEFKCDGHTLVRGLASPEELAAYRPAISDYVQRMKTETRPLEERDTYGRAFLQIMNLWMADETARKFTLAKRFAQVAADLLGVDGVRLYHDQALYKEAKGGHTPWHQDQFYWPLDTDKTVTLWMPLVDVSLDMGALTFASGSHADGFLGHIAISDDSQATYDKLVADKGFSQAVSPMKAGDATFHTGWTLHWAPGNQTDQTREVMTIIYYADGTRILPVIDNANRQNDLEGWLPGVRPGELAVSDLNPLVYQR